LACFTVPSHDDDCGCSRWRHRSSDGHAVSVQSTSSVDRPAQDRWANWILQQRFGGDPEQRDRVLGFLAPIRDTVLSGAALQPGDVVLDVGCGDGLLGFGALDLVGPTGRVMFSDVSTDLLEQCTRLLDRAGDGRGSTVEAALPDLAAVGDQATDVVVLRSVLIYVHDKARAFQALHRVLRPGGRLSLFEPINSFGFPEPDGYLWGFNMFGLEEQAAKVHTAYTETVDTGDGDPMLGFDERDLLRWAEQAGFTNVTLDHRARIVSSHPSAGTSLHTFLATSPNPMIGSFGDQLHHALSPDEVQQVTQRMNDDLHAGRGQYRQAHTYLTAEKAT